eukprot:SAG11_NODE_7486_length_1137_cov_2.763969_1_plen_95_part_00
MIVCFTYDVAITTSLFCAQVNAIKDVIHARRAIKSAENKLDSAKANLKKKSFKAIQKHRGKRQAGIGGSKRANMAVAANSQALAAAAAFAAEFQ